jgi:hypothetical protein
MKPNLDVEHPSRLPARGAECKALSRTEHPV